MDFIFSVWGPAIWIKKNMQCYQESYRIEWLEGPCLDERYTIHDAVEALASETGLLCLFELVPSDRSLPRFRGRWDEKADTLDVDILNVDES
jgi:hypothetical protein